MRLIAHTLHTLCAATGAAVLLAAATASAACPGDCNGSQSVAINELVTCVNIALGATPVSNCVACDVNADGSVAINELIAAVNAALNGSCPADATATPTGPPTPTPTLAIEPIFPANYRETFTEVRDCRLGIEHGGVMIRVLANDVAAVPYRQNQNPLPVGSIVVKEEYDGIDCSNDAELMRWAAMRKEAPGFDSEDGDWHWQRVRAPARTVVCDDKRCPGFACIGCHRAAACVARDYMCTVDDTPPRGTLTPVLESVPAALLSIAGTSATDVYAVGADPGDGKGPYVIHYDGSGWERLQSDASGDLWWLSVTPIDGDFYMAGAGGLILQYHPPTKSFTHHTTPGTALLFGIWGTSAGDLWAVGGDPDTPDTGGVIWHFDGLMWTAEDLTGIRNDGIPTLNKVWGRSATDVFAVGLQGVILHYDGVHWSLVDSGITNPLFTVHGGGSVLAAVGGFFLNGVIIEQQGDGSFLRRTPGGAPQLNGVFVPPSGDAIAVGNGLAVAARSSSGWSLVATGEDPLSRDFHSVWIDPDGGIWAVGGDLSLDLSDGILAYGGTQNVPGGTP